MVPSGNMSGAASSLGSGYSINGVNSQSPRRKRRRADFSTVTAVPGAAYSPYLYSNPAQQTSNSGFMIQSIPQAVFSSNPGMPSSSSNSPSYLFQDLASPVGSVNSVHTVQSQPRVVIPNSSFNLDNSVSNSGTSDLLESLIDLTQEDGGHTPLPSEENFIQVHDLGLKKESTGLKAVKPKKKKKKNKIVEEEEEGSPKLRELLKKALVCPVCMNPCKDITSTLCGHIYCRDCIVHCIQKYQNCPICSRRLNCRMIHPLYFS
mmetsp:Transcript_3692/g.4430  ORF Transcript_3692/g.4430 Transcript_3692/m.4430 type:complete len:262 (+) Transcript_3692:179-964(+)